MQVTYKKGSVISEVIPKLVGNLNEYCLVGVVSKYCPVVLIRVFYITLDEFFCGVESELIYKKLYVGLSRATFNFGITYCEKLEEIAGVEEYFEDGINGW